MLKRLIAGLIVIASVSSFTACSSNKKAVETSNPPTNTQSNKTESDSKVQTVDKVTFNIQDAKIEAVVGDRTANNVAQKNGEYFADGSNIVKASDYEYITVSVKIDNKSDKAIQFSEMGWIAKLKDGYKFKKIECTDKLNEQIPSNSSGEGKVKILKEKSVSAKEIVLTYNFLDYGDDYKKYLEDIIKNSLSEDKVKEKYGDKFKPKEINFNIKL